MPAPKNAPKKATSRKTPSKDEVAAEEEERIETEQQAALDDAKSEESDDAPKPEVEDETEKAKKDNDAAIEILAPVTEPRRWIIGKPPEKGGVEAEYSIYYQEPMSYMQRIYFMSLVTKTMADAIKMGGSIEVNGADILNADGGTLRERAASMADTEFGDVASFFALALQFMSTAPNFLIDCYCIWLDIPNVERAWAKRVFKQRHHEEDEQWGLTDDEHIEIVQVFISQNYDDLREFFTGKIPTLVKQVRDRERALTLKSAEKKSRKSESDR